MIYDYFVETFDFLKYHFQREVSLQSEINEAKAELQDTLHKYHTLSARDKEFSGKFKSTTSSVPPLLCFCNFEFII